jgi:ParB-like chromosome segregation protein Spo0J
MAGETMALAPTGDLPTGTHPVADLFPMMTADELADLAADIAANGLRHPIVLDGDGRVLDGRNRLAACRLAGVEPAFTGLTGRDPVAAILAANVARRRLSKGQAALAAAKALALWPVSQGAAARATGLSRTRVVQAAVVLDHAPDLADAVLAGATPLNAAYAEARARKRAAAALDAQLAGLHGAAPDLAARVTAGRMTVAEAVGALAERRAGERRARREATRRVARILALLDPVGDGAPEQEAARLVGLFDPATLRDRPDLSAERLRRCQAVLAALVDGLRRRG